MARPRKLNVAKTGNHNKEDLEYQELKENGLSQFNKIDIKSFPTDLTKEGKKSGNVSFLYSNNYLSRT